MKIEKSKLSKALKQIGIFVGKNNISKSASMVHFRNEGGRAMIFATDFASAGRAYFDTEEQGLFEFCIEYAQLLQSTRIRGKEITAEIFENRQLPSGEMASGIEFYDDKTTFTWALHDPSELVGIEEKTVIPDIPYFEIDAKTMKSSLKEAGYARDEKDTQNPFITGVNFVTDGKDVCMASTDRHRIASWKQPQQTLEGMESNSMTGILSPKTVQSVNLFDDGDTIRIYIAENQIVIVSPTLEAYASKIQCQYPDLSKFFGKPVLSSYEINSKEAMESLSIVDGLGAKTLNLSFKEDRVDISVRTDTGENVEDSFPCKRLTGEDKDISLSPDLFNDIFKNVVCDTLKLEFRDIAENFEVITYSAEDGAYGMLAPQKR